MHLEARHKTFIAWFLQEVSKQCVIKVIFISCLSRKASARSRRKGERVLFLQSVFMCARCDEELSVCGQTAPPTFTYSAAGNPRSADITATWTLHVSHHSFTSCLSRTEAGWELGGGGGSKTCCFIFFLASSCFLPLWLHFGSDSPY